VLKNGGGAGLPRIVFLSEAKELRCLAPLNMTTTGIKEIFNSLIMLLRINRYHCRRLGD
jgi:hypothetical protein